MTRLDRVLMVAAAVIVIALPVPLLLVGRYPSAWRWRGLMATDVVGFGLAGVAVVRSLWRVRAARLRAERFEADAREAHRRLDELLERLAARRRGGPLS